MTYLEELEKRVVALEEIISTINDFDQKLDLIIAKQKEITANGEVILEAIKYICVLYP